MFYYLALVLISFGSSLILGKPLINLLNSFSAKQTIREDGPLDHITKKAQIPTIGSLIFLIPTFLITFGICFLKKEFQTLDLLSVAGITFLMAILGLSDDLIKILKKQNKGISGWLKLFIQFMASLVIFYLYKEDKSLIYLIWIFFIIAGASNSYNLTDGLDGLLASITISSLLGFLFLTFSLGKTELLSFLVILSGSISGFLYFNKYPAKVFMGDTGSLAIGGLVGSLAVILKSELYLICFAAIPILETLSVILQVASCQLSKKFLGVDKRIFKMAPLHHHFELCGWKETLIVKRFLVFQLICVLIGILIFFNS